MSEEDEVDIEPSWTDVTIPISELVGRIVWWILSTMLLLAIPFAIVNGWSALLPPPLSSSVLGDAAVNILILLGIYVLSVPVHEGLHAAGMIITGTPVSAISAGARLRQGVVYIHCDHVMPLKAYLFSLLLPVVVTGFLPAIAGVAIGSAWVTIYAGLMIVSAVGDLEMTWRLRRLSGDTPVRDHPELLGCMVQLKGGDSPIGSG